MSDKMDNERDPPIIEHDYLYGLKVVDIGDVRVARGQSRRASSSCPHRKLCYDAQERRVWCKDCEKDVEGFDAFVGLATRYGEAIAALERREECLKEAETFQVRSLAAKEIDKAWRSRNSVPICPSCNNGLFPEDFKNGCSSMSIDFARRRRAQYKGHPLTSPTI